MEWRMNLNLTYDNMNTKEQNTYCVDCWLEIEYQQAQCTSCRIELN